MGSISVGAPLGRISIDIVGPLHTTVLNNKYFLTATEHFTKWTEVYPIPDQTAETCAQKILDELSAILVALKVYILNKEAVLKVIFSSNYVKCYRLGKLEPAPVIPKENPNPQQVDPEIHLSEREQEASLLFWITKKNPQPFAAAGSAQQSVPSIDLPVLKSAMVSYFGSIPTSNTLPLDCPPIPAITEIQPLDHEVAETEVSTEFLDTRVVVAEGSDLADQILHLSDPPATPSPPKSPESLVPRPSLPDFVLPPTSEVEENLMPQLLGMSLLLSLPEPTTEKITPVLDDPHSLQSAFQKLISAVNKGNTLLEKMSKQMEKNHDMMEKVEVVIRRGNMARPRSPVRPYFNTHTYRRPRSPLKRRFIPARTVSPSKKVKSCVRSPLK
ncbi:Hypothetical predicted protein [Mytilus galloprovincialis]|uniref:Uncharacterized protein n=1 Tax=Mytilus galloprovincialis TaxID=29158 RepID=A0A8B6G0M4_MYTGA|nr:Hypothetical predicted protein [Mytilus galloprovincialis]